MSHPAWHGYDEIPQEVLGDPDTIFLNLSGGWQQVPDYIRRAGLSAVEEGYLKIQPSPNSTGQWRINSAMISMLKSTLPVR